MATLDPRSGPRNMAVDAALLQSVADGAPPVVRVYRWQPACLSFGRNQRARGAWDAGQLAARGWDVVRRPTGGLAVLHDAELTYAVVAPAGALGGPRRAYRILHEAIAGALNTLGVRAGLAGAGVVPSPDGAVPVCFASPVGGEVLAGGRKLVGSAQRCERRTILQHGSLLLSGRQDRIDGDGRDESIALDEVMETPPTLETLAAALRAGFRDTLGVDLGPADLSERERALARQLEDVYRDDAWTWRR